MGKTRILKKGPKCKSKREKRRSRVHGLAQARSDEQKHIARHPFVSLQMVSADPDVRQKRRLVAENIRRSSK